MVLIERAARNNAVWCDAVCESHGAPGAFSSACWSARGEPPPFYPSVVTLNARDIRAQKAEIAAARDANANGCAVKDSFATLDLSDLGFRVLIEGSWIRHEAKADKPDETIWTRIGDQENLSAWERAWRGGGLDGAEPIFLNPLLTRSDIAIFAARRGDEIAAGCIVNRDAACAGFTNLFAAENAHGLRAGAVACARQFANGSPLVGWAPDHELGAYQEIGFHAVAPMRVWTREG